MGDISPLSIAVVIMSSDIRAQLRFLSAIREWKARNGDPVALRLGTLSSLPLPFHLRARRSSPNQSQLQDMSAFISTSSYQLPIINNALVTERQLFLVSTRPNTAPSGDARLHGLKLPSGLSPAHGTT